jgi:hypothetical protein
MQHSSKFSLFIREPLFHFLFLGVGIFLLYAQVHESEVKPSIVISKASMEEVFMTFEKENNKAPNEADKKRLLQAEIRQEVLYREALAMGLDEQDRVVKHRLAEKMAYLFEDTDIFEEGSEQVMDKQNQDFYTALKSHYSISIEQ